MSQMHPNRSVTQHSRQVLARHARSFRWASLFLPAQARDDAALAYAFCRRVDDLVDEQPDAKKARRALDALEVDLEAATPRDPLLRAYRDLAHERGFGLEPARELIAGARSDLGHVRTENDDELLRYCHRVAGTVGLMMCGILGVREARAARHAVHLGIAMQLTNICRDVLEDALRDRVYLPRSRLAALALDGEQLVRGTVDRRALARVVRQLLQLADRYYASGEAGMRFIPARQRWAVMVASRLYRAIGRRLGALGADVLAGRTVVPWLAKLGWVAKATAAWLASLWPAARMPMTAQTLQAPVETFANPAYQHGATRAPRGGS